MMTVEQATKALIAAIDAERQRLPRGASEAERKLLELCANAESLMRAAGFGQYAWRGGAVGRVGWPGPNNQMPENYNPART